MSKETEIIAIIVDGKLAKKEIDAISNKTKRLEETTTKTESVMKKSYIAIAGAVALVGAAFVAVGSKALELEKLQSALGNSIEKNTNMLQKDTGVWDEYITKLGLAAGITKQEAIELALIGTSAKLSTEQLMWMMETATGLGKAFPDEQVKTFAEDLTESLKVGKPVGQMLQRMEEQLGLVGTANASTADMIHVMTEMAKGQNETFNKTKAGKFHRVYEKIKAGVVGLADGFVGLIGNMIEYTELEGKVTFASAMVIVGFQQLHNWILQTRIAWNDFTGDSDEASELRDRLIFLKDEQREFIKEIRKTKEERVAEASEAKRIALEQTIAQTEKQKAYREEQTRLKEVNDAVKTFGDEQYKVAETGVKNIDKLTETYNKLDNAIQSGAMETSDTVIRAYNNIAQEVSNSILQMNAAAYESYVYRQSLNTYHTGGQVRHTGGSAIKRHTGGSGQIGGGGGYNEVQITALQDEFVMNRQAVKANKKDLIAMNAGQSPSGSNGKNTPSEFTMNIIGKSLNSSDILNNVPAIKSAFLIAMDDRSFSSQIKSKL